MRRGSFRAAGVLAVFAMTIGMLAGGVANAAPTNGTVKSFDGVNIAYTFLPVDDVKRPVVFYTHGWGGSRTTDPNNPTIKLFNDNGYHVLTWDARGFGASGGEANVDSQEFEVRDVQALITMVAALPNVLTDDTETQVEVLCEDPEATEPCFETVPPRDPRMGMYGGSYAGGIQLMTASADARVDAIAPQIAWNDLPQSLKPGGVIKLGWDVLLYGAGLATAAAGGLSSGETGAYNGHIHQSLVEGAAINDWSTATHNWFASKSPARYINGATLADGRVLPGIQVPALIIQGMSDTLFNFNQGIANMEQIRANGQPVKFVGFCGGHTIAALGTSCVSTGSGAVINDRLIRWLDRYVKRDGSVDTGAEYEIQMNDGSFIALDSLPGAITTNSAETRVTHSGAPTSGQGTAPTPAGCRERREDETGVSRSYMADCPVVLADWIPLGTQTGPPPRNCGDLPKPPCLPTFKPLLPGTKIIGSVHVDARALGSAPESYVFFKLIDYETATKTATVIDDQVTAHRITWPNLNTVQNFSIDLAGVSWEIKPGHVVYLEVAPSSNDHASSRYPGNTTLQLQVTVPGIANPEQ